MPSVLFVTAPDEAPNITNVNSPTSTSLMISWTAPSVDKQNGLLTEYMILYTNDVELPMSEWQMDSTLDTSITLTGLRIFTNYIVSVAATTIAGVGPYDAPVQVQTLSDSK